ncbi:hypothetical protein [Candidatus Electronema sp. JC]
MEKNQTDEREVFIRHCRKDAVLAARLDQGIKVPPGMVGAVQPD